MTSSQRQQRIKEMKRRKRRQALMRKLVPPCIIVAVVCMILVRIGLGFSDRGEKKEIENGYDSDKSGISESNTDTGGLSGGYSDEDSQAVSDRDLIERLLADSIEEELAYVEALKHQSLGGSGNNPPLYAAADASTVFPDEEVVSENVVFIDVEAGRIMGQKDAMTRISPASMTKILTVLVAAEHVTDLDDTFEITRDITDYSFVNGCSIAGFAVGEKVTVRDLFYGTVLPSGADASLGLAVYVAGSQEAFVELMNDKIDELGLSGTSHFTNCVGVYDEDHYSTVYDIAVMLKAACDNSLCREVLSAHTYTTSLTEENPEGITISNWFLRRIEDKDTHGEVLCAKTGYVDQSGNCAASLSIGKDQKEYICVTAHAYSVWRCIYDQTALYQQFLPG